MRMHIVGLPHTDPWDDQFSWCAYSGKVKRFDWMMRSLGHTVETYAGPEWSDAVGMDHTDHWDPADPMWTQMTEKVLKGLEDKAAPGDLLCLIMGLDQAPIAAARQDLVPVEFGVGYQGTFAPFRVFESYAWMHAVYGSAHPAGRVMSAQGKFFDTVIPNYYDTEEFPFDPNGGDYLLFVGRATPLKGVDVVNELAQRGYPCVAAGGGDTSLFHESVKHVGMVQPKERGELMSKAAAVLVPTLYLEPFGGVHAEARLCGTPVITTDWGVFPESVTQGVDGYRCRILRDFMDAADACLNGYLDRPRICQRARQRFDQRVIRYTYDTYLRRVLTVGEGRGFYEGA